MHTLFSCSIQESIYGIENSLSQKREGKALAIISRPQCHFNHTNNLPIFAKRTILLVEEKEDEEEKEQ